MKKETFKDLAEITFGLMVAELCVTAMKYSAKMAVEITKECIQKVKDKKAEKDPKKDDSEEVKKEAED